MQIRRATTKDMDGLNKLLMQVLMVHHYGRPDLFKANVKKYTDEELQGIIADDKTPIFVGVDENAMRFYEKCGLVPQKVGMEVIL